MAEDIKPPAVAVDAITGVPPSSPAQPQTPAAGAVKGRMMKVLLLLVVAPYGAFILWCFFLMTILPSPTGDLQAFGRIALMSLGLGALFIVAVAGFGVMRVSSSHDISDRARAMGLMRIGIFVLPGLLTAGLAAFAITQEPSLTIAITDPVRAEDLVAPLAVTFDLQPALEVLEKLGLKGVEYAWDFNGDGEKDQDTVVPQATAYYDRAGGYNVAARVVLNDGSTRRLDRRLVIPRAVFSVQPIKPVVNQPIRFSVAHLIADPKTLREVQWDFDGDGQMDETHTEMTAVHTYVRTQTVPVTAVVLLTDQVQNRYDRTITIAEPEALPFPVKIVSEPTHLISPAPFGTIFHIETEEPLAQVTWDFGDDESATGERVGHTYDRVGNFLLSVDVVSQTGATAKLSELVRVVDPLRLPDLQFDGTPEVSSNNMLKGEVPVTVDLRPHTSQPLIEFLWEVPEASSVGSTETNVQAIYRRPGTYTITLVAQDPEGHAMRLPLTLEVTPPESLVAIRMTPEGGVAPLTVRLDASESVVPGEEISGFEWYIGEDESPLQAGAIIQHIFDEPGTYNVRAVARTTKGNSYESTSTIVIRAPVLDACFFASRTEGDAPLGVSFDMSCTTGETSSVTWDFGDGSESDERAPIHVFNLAGTYDVVLAIRNAAGVESTHSVKITAK